LIFLNHKKRDFPFRKSPFLYEEENYFFNFLLSWIFLAPYPKHPANTNPKPPSIGVGVGGGPPGPAIATLAITIEITIRLKSTLNDFIVSRII